MYSRAEWRLIEDADHDGAWNMAADEAILRSVAGGRSPVTLRLYSWRPACLSLGRGQSGDDVDWHACWAAGVTCVRRPTGGRAILHGRDLTYSICLPLSDPRASGDVTESYRRLSEGLVEGVRLLGVAVERAAAGADGAKPSSACFDAPSGYEIAFQGRKLLGSAQYRSGGALLQHGSLPLYGDVAAVADFLGLAVERRTELRARLRRAATTLEEASGRSCSFREVAEALRRGIEQALSIRFDEGGLSAAEKQMAEELARTKYASIPWGGSRQAQSARALLR